MWTGAACWISIEDCFARLLLNRDLDSVPSAQIRFQAMYSVDSSEQDAGSNQQKHADRDLTHYECATEPRSARIVSKIAFRRLHDVGSSGLDRGSKAEQYRRYQGTSQSEAENTNVRS